MKLYIVAVGGKVDKANIEVHDVQFVVGNTFEETLDQIRNNWFGDPMSLHVDAYQEIMGIDSHVIAIKEMPSHSDKEIYLVYTGGHVKTNLEESHQLGLFVGETISEVRTKASEKLFGNFDKEHFDIVKPISNCIGAYYIHLEESKETFEIKPQWQGYMRL